MKPLAGNNYWALLQDGVEVVRQDSESACFARAVELSLVRRTPPDERSDGRGLSLVDGVTIVEREASIRDLTAPLSAENISPQFSISGKVIENPATQRMASDRSLQASLSARVRHPRRYTGALKGAKG